MDWLSIGLSLIAAFGIPGAVTTFITRRMEKRMDARDKANEERDKAQKKMMVLTLQGVSAAISLGEATGHALQRGAPNGDMEAALDYAKTIKHQTKDFLTEQAAGSLFDK